jgi:hypothetical protein
MLHMLDRSRWPRNRVRRAPLFGVRQASEQDAGVGTGCEAALMRRAGNSCSVTVN